MSLSVRVVLPGGDFIFIRGLTSNSLVKDVLDRLQSQMPTLPPGLLWYQGRALAEAHTLAEEGITSGVSLNWTSASSKPKETWKGERISEGFVPGEALKALVPFSEQLNAWTLGDLRAGKLRAFWRLRQLQTLGTIDGDTARVPGSVENAQDTEQALRAGLELAQRTLASVSNTSLSTLENETEARWRLEQLALALRWLSDGLFCVSAIASAGAYSGRGDAEEALGCTAALRELLGRIQSSESPGCQTEQAESQANVSTWQPEISSKSTSASRSGTLSSRATGAGSVLATSLGGIAGAATAKKTTFRTQAVPAASVPKRSAAFATTRSAPVIDSRLESLIDESELQRWKALLARDARYQPSAGMRTLSVLYRSTGRHSVGL